MCRQRVDVCGVCTREGGTRLDARRGGCRSVDRLGAEIWPLWRSRHTPPPPPQLVPSECFVHPLSADWPLYKCPARVLWHATAAFFFVSARIDRKKRNADPEVFQLAALASRFACRRRGQIPMSSSRIPTYTRALHLRKLACHRNKTSCEASVCRSFSCLCGIIRNVFVSSNKLPPAE